MSKVNYEQKLMPLIALAVLGCGAEAKVSEFDFPKNKNDVMNGAAVEHSQVSFITALTRGDGTIPSCTGSLIKPDLVVTAAHCVSGIKPDWVVYGSRNIEEYDADCLFEISGTAHHPDFNPYWYIETPSENPNSSALNHDERVPRGMNIHDIAIILLKKTILYSDPIDILPIESYDKMLPEGEIVQLCGYGMDNFDDAGTLKCGEVPLQKNYGSDLVFSANYPDGDDGFPGQEPDACYGDSGGPTFIPDLRTLISVTSRLPPDAPQVLCGYGYIGTSVGYHQSWLKKEEYVLRESKIENDSNSNADSKPYPGRDGICIPGLLEEDEPIIMLDPSGCAVSSHKSEKTLPLGTLLLIYALRLARRKNK